MRVRLVLSVVLPLIAIASACSSEPPEAADTTTTVVSTSMPLSGVDEAEIESTQPGSPDETSVPESLALAESFSDPNGHYELAIGPDWEQRGSPDEVSTTWAVAPATAEGFPPNVVVGSVPTLDFTLDDFLEPGLSDGHAVVETTRVDDSRAIVVYRTESARFGLVYVLTVAHMSAGRVVQGNFGATEAKFDELRPEIEPLLLTLSRTPVDQDDEFTVLPEVAASIEATLQVEGGLTDSQGSCLARVLSNPRYRSTFFDLQGSESVAYNAWADVYEMEVHCGIEHGLIGTPATPTEDEYLALFEDTLPLAAAAASEKGLEILHLVDDVCAEFNTGLSDAALGAALRRLEPEGVFDEAAEPFANFVGTAAEWKRPDLLYERLPAE